MLRQWLLWRAWSPRRCRGSRRRERGTATVEYVVLLSTVALGLTLAVIGLGVPLVRTYLEQSAILALPFP
jgi:Flp pilus assembly pilin Flp